MLHYLNEHLSKSTFIMPFRSLHFTGLSRSHRSRHFCRAPAHPELQASAVASVRRGSFFKFRPGLSMAVSPASNIWLINLCSMTVYTSWQYLSYRSVRLRSEIGFPCIKRFTVRCVCVCVCLRVCLSIGCSFQFIPIASTQLRTIYITFWMCVLECVRVTCILHVFGLNDSAIRYQSTE